MGQEEIWLADQAVPDSAAFTLPDRWEVRGPIEPAVLRRALQAVVDAHEGLRSRFAPYDDGIRLTVAERSAVDFDVVDTRALPAGRGPGPVAEFFARRFDLAAGSPFRARLITDGADRHSILLVFHHIACDGWSAALVRAEIAAAYAALLAGTGPDLPPEPVGYREFTAGTRAHAGAAAAPEDGDTVPPLVLPLDADRPRLPSRAGGLVGTELSRDAVDRLAELATGRGQTPFATYLALYGVLLAGWSGQRRFPVSTPITARTDPRLERTVGYLVDHRELPFDLTGITRLGELTDRVTEAVLGLVDRTGAAAPGRAADPSRAGGGQVTFGFEPFLTSTFRLGPARVRVVPAHLGAAKADLAMRVVVGPDSARVDVEYDADVLRPSTVRRLVDHFAELVSAAAVTDDLAALPSLPRADRAAVRRLGRGGPSRGDGPGASVVERLAAVARDHPGAMAIRSEAAVLDHGRFWSTAGGLAGRLVAAGVGPEDRVGLCLPRGEAALVAMVGVLRAGGCVVALDVRDPVPRRAAMLRRVGAVLLLAEPGTDTGDWSGPVLSPPWPTAEADGSMPGDHPEPDAAAFLLHTSGSTGPPKAVLATHRGLATYCSWASAEYGLVPGTEMPLHAPLIYDAALMCTFTPWTGGAGVHVLPEVPDRHLGIVPRLGEYQVLDGTPTYLDVIMDAADEGAAGPPVVISGGERITAVQAERMRRHWPDARIVNEYGPSETVISAAVAEVRPPYPGGYAATGAPIPGTRLHVVDDLLRPVPVGVWGELLIGGSGVARGYLGQPALTAERFVPDPDGAARGARAYRTGDVARWTGGGVLELRGRRDHQVKLLGRRIEPGEIEAVLREAPPVAEAVVRIDVRPRPRVVAWVRLHDSGADPAADLAEVRRYARGQLPGHLVPDDVVAVAAMPLTRGGKLDRSALIPPAAVARSAAPDLPTELHAVLHDAWCSVLGAERIGTDVGFFDAGGTSEALLKLYGELTADRGLPVTVTDLFRYPTIDALAGRLLAAAPAPAAGPGPLDRAAARAGRRRRSGDRR